MSSSYKFLKPEGIYFTTSTVVEWVDIFTRPDYADIVIESLKFCQKEKGLLIHCWCLMSNHLHLIISKNGMIPLEDIMRDFKKFTASTILQTIETISESRRDWMLEIFHQAGLRNPNNKKYQFWQQDNHPLQLFSDKFIEQKINYIHENPVKAGLVDRPEDYRYSSAGDYEGDKGLIQISLIDLLRKSA